MLDIGRVNTRSIRVESSSTNITRGGFICNAMSWADGILHYVGVDWLAIIDEPTWQKGLFKSSNFKTWGLEERVKFDKPFNDGPPFLFACLSGIEIVGKWSVCMYTTNIDHTGFTVGIVNSGEEGGELGNLKFAAVTWIAIPGTEPLKRKHVWTGTFNTSTGSSFDLEKNGWGGWKGHVEFGFKFNRTPKIFIGLRQFCESNSANFRLNAAVSKVTTSGMDWGFGKWEDTKLLSAGANFLAVDVD